VFDAVVVMGRLPEGSFFALLAEHGGRMCVMKTSRSATRRGWAGRRSHRRGWRR
jgi:hypothetical protein